jgi:ATP-dependent DNA helicase Rep
MELPQDDLEWETERKVVSAQERMVKGQSHLEKIREQLAKAKNSG